MDLFVIKTDEGYLKAGAEDDFQIVELDKASVFKAANAAHLEDLKVRTGLQGLTNTRIAKLSIMEMDYYETN